MQRRQYRATATKCRTQPTLTTRVALTSIQSGSTNSHYELCEDRFVEKSRIDLPAHANFLTRPARLNSKQSLSNHNDQLAHQPSWPLVIVTFEFWVRVVASVSRSRKTISPSGEKPYIFVTKPYLIKRKQHGFIRASTSKKDCLSGQSFTPSARKAVKRYPQSLGFQKQVNSFRGCTRTNVVRTKHLELESHEVSVCTIK